MPITWPWGELPLIPKCGRLTQGDLLRESGGLHRRFVFLGQDQGFRVRRVWLLWMPTEAEVEEYRSRDDLDLAVPQTIHLDAEGTERLARLHPLQERVDASDLEVLFAAIALAREP